MQYLCQPYTNYRCVACNLYFSNFDEQKHHYFTYHSRSVDQGSLTSTIYSSYRQLSGSNKKVLPVKCDICNISCSSQTAYDFHVKGKKHSKALNKIALNKSENLVNSNELVSKDKSNDVPADVPFIQQSQILYKPNLVCDICQVNCLKLEQLQKHLSGSRHQKKMKLNRFVELKAKKDPLVYCDICDIFMTEESMLKHRNSGKHKRKSTDKSADESAEKKAKTVDIPTSVEHCGFCHVTLKSPSDAVTHYQTPKHALNMINRSRNFELWCDICQISFANQHFLDLHLKGFRHYARINRGNTCPEGKLGDRLLKMREKMKALKHNTRFKKFSYAEKYKFVPNEPPPNKLASPGSDSRDESGLANSATNDHDPPVATAAAAPQ